MKTEQELKVWCRANWSGIPADQRKRCLDHLDGWIPRDIQEHWKRGGFGPDFHMFGGGMSIRNRLRDVMKDDQLPPVQYEHGMAQNWDDYYTGALDELLERLP